MPEFFEVLANRRSIRSYQPEPVSEAEIKELIDAAVLAPSGVNLQPWRFLVITNQKLLADLNARLARLVRASEMIQKAEAFKAIVNNPSFSIFYNAPALILILGNTQVPTAMIDCQLALENLFLAAAAKGLGTCYMGFLLMFKDAPEIKELLPLPEGFDLMASTIVGHPKVIPAIAAPRHAPQIEWMR